MRNWLIRFGMLGIRGRLNDIAACIAWMLIAGAIAAEIILLWSGFPVLVHRRTVDTLEGIRIGFDPALID